MADQQFCIELGERHIKVAHAAKRGKQLEAYAFAYEENPYNIYVTEGEKITEQTSAILNKLIEDCNIKKKSVRIIIPDSFSYSRIIQMPYLTEKELLSAIRYQADQFVPIPIDKVNLDVEVLYTDKKNKRILILIVAAPNLAIDKAISVAESAGLLPEVVENEASAMLRFISWLHTEHKSKYNENEYSLFINGGFSATSLYLYQPFNDLACEIHNFPLGIDLFLRSIKANFNVPDSDVRKMLETSGFIGQDPHFNTNQVLSSSYNEISSEIEKFILSAQSKYSGKISAIYLSGESFKIAGFSDKLSVSLGVPTKILDLYPFFVKNTVVDFFKSDLPLFVPTIGGNID